MNALKIQNHEEFMASVKENQATKINKLEVELGRLKKYREE